MRKILIFTIAIVASFIFAACESASAKSPPVQSSKFQVQSSILTINAEIPAPQVAQSDPARLDRLNCSTLELALENKITVESPATFRDNRFRFQPKTIPIEKTKYFLPPERFIGFGVENSARAKI